jgi:hypothetical protein
VGRAVAVRSSTVWREAALAPIDQAAKPRADVELAIVALLRKLAAAAAEIGQLAELGPRAWTARVEALAAPPPPRRRSSRACGEGPGPERYAPRIVTTPTHSGAQCHDAGGCRAAAESQPFESPTLVGEADRR